jgi:HEAT repeat protein
LIAVFYLCCALVAYESVAQTGLYDRTAELVAMAIRSHWNRPASEIPKPMTLAMVRQSLENDRGAKRMRAVLAAKRFVADNPDLVGPLVRIYLDRNTGHRTAAAAGMVLRSAGGPFGPDSVDELVRVMQDRKKCCMSIDEKKKDPEEKGLRDKHPVRYQALEMLCGMNSGVAGVVPSIIEADYSKYSNCLNGDREQYLESIGPGQRRDIPALSRLMFSTDARIRYDAAICLGYHSDASERVTPLLLGALESEDSSGMRCIMLMSLARVAGRGESSARLIAGALGDPNCIVRADAARLLGDFEVNRESHAAMLLKALDDFWPPVRQHAAESLGKLAFVTPEITKRLLTALNDEEYTVRLAAAETLVKLGRKQWIDAAVQLVTTHLLDKDPAIRRAAVKTVSRIGPNALGAADSLVRMLRGEVDSETVSYICIALGSIGPGASSAASTLVELLENGDARLACSASKTLRSIGLAGESEVAKLVGVMRAAERKIGVRVAAAGALLCLAPDESDVLAEALEFLRGQVRLRPAMDHWPIELLASHQPMSVSTAVVLRQFIADYRAKSWASSVAGGGRAVMLAAEGMGRSADPKTARDGTAVLVWMMKTGLPDYDPEIVRSMKQANLGRYDYRLAAIEALGRLGPSAAGAAEHIREMTRWKDLRLIAPARAALKRVASKI